MKEFALIEKISHLFSSVPPAGIGDDAALLPEGVLVAKDLVAEGVHFLATTPLESVIHKLFTANVSDIAAMGGRAERALMGVAIPTGADTDALVRGIEAACRHYQITLVGGDTTASAAGLFISLTILGRPGANVLTRGGARPGDAVFLSRPTGLSRLSLEAELGTRNEGLAPHDHYSREAETSLGEALGALRDVHSCIDISDGLGRDLSHIADASGVLIELDAGAIPTAPLKAWGLSQEEALIYAVSSGEEFALAFTAPPAAASPILQAFPSVCRIGTVREGSGTVLVMPDGTRADISTSGFEHTS